MEKKWVVKRQIFQDESQSQVQEMQQHHVMLILEIENHSVITRDTRQVQNLAHLLPVSKTNYVAAG